MDVTLLKGDDRIILKTAGDWIRAQCPDPQGVYAGVFLEKIVGSDPDYIEL